MRYDDVSPAMRMFMGNREGFRKLGFSADDLYLGVGPLMDLLGQTGCLCILRTQGKEFSVLCGPVEDGVEFAAEYERICVNQHLFSQEDVDRIWQESEVFAKKVDFIRALQAKGFRIPGKN